MNEIDLSRDRTGPDLALTGCAPAATPTAAPAAPGSAPAASAALNITGAVAKPLALTMAALKALPAAQVKAESPQAGDAGLHRCAAERACWSRPSRSASAAKMLTLMASDGFASDISLADVRKCADCLLSFNGEQAGRGDARPGQQHLGARRGQDRGQVSRTWPGHASDCRCAAGLGGLGLRHDGDGVHFHQKVGVGQLGHLHRGARRQRIAL